MLYIKQLELEVEKLKKKIVAEYLVRVKVINSLEFENSELKDNLKQNKEQRKQISS